MTRGDPASATDTVHRCGGFECRWVWSLRGNGDNVFHPLGGGRFALVFQFRKPRRQSVQDTVAICEPQSCSNVGVGEDFVLYLFAGPGTTTSTLRLAFACSTAVATSQFPSQRSAGQGVSGIVGVLFSSGAAGIFRIPVVEMSFAFVAVVSPLLH